MALSTWASLATLLAVVINVYMYTFPSMDVGNCSWSRTYRDLSKLSPLEQKICQIPYIGDIYTSHFVPEDHSLQQEPKDIRMMAIGDPQINGNWKSTSYAKRLDNWGTDFYIGHVYSVMEPRLDPDYVAVMGDMFSSQWILDSMFYNRTKRMMTRLFPRAYEQTFAELDFIEEQKDIDWTSHMYWFKSHLENGYFKTRNYYAYKDVHDWTDSNITGAPLILNVTGNHDVGYGDTTYQHMARWRKLFGKDNFWIEYDSETDHPWRIVMLNDLDLDGPLLQPEFQEYDWQFVQAVADTNYTGTTILLTHIPMYKPEGLCVDGPYVSYFNETNCPAKVNCHVGVLKSENHLQYETTQKVMNAVFKDSKAGLILTGHDHEGCESVYSLDEQSGEWSAAKNATSAKFVKEVTVRSVMGDYGGNTGIVTGHFNHETGAWEFDYGLCRFGVQHIWWASKISVLLAILLWSVKLFR